MPNTRSSPGKAPPTKPGSPDHSDSEISVIGKYVDALHVSVRGRLRTGFAEALGGMKETLRETGGKGEELLPVAGLPGGSLRLRPGGRGKYDFVLKNDSVYLEITTVPNRPALRIRFETHVLYEHNLDGLESMVDTLAEFFLVPGYEVLVTQFDLALDFHRGEGGELPDVKDVVTRARKRKVEGDGPEPDTMTFGRRNGAVQVQIYDKTKELLKKPAKSWTYGVWGQSEKYTEGFAVTRVEYRFFRKKLRELGINAVADLRSSIGNLVRVVVGDEQGTNSWVRVADPETRGRRQDHRPAAHWWEEIRAASLDGTIHNVALDKCRHRGPDVQHTQKTLFALIERYRVMGAGEGLHPEETTLEEFLDVVVAQYYAHLNSKDLTPSEAVEARREKMGIGAMPLGPAVTSTAR